MTVSEPPTRENGNENRPPAGPAWLHSMIAITASGVLGIAAGYLVEWEVGATVFAGAASALSRNRQ